MKRVKVLSLAMALTMALAFTGCDKANKECQAVGDEFLQALIAHEDDDMLDYVKDDDAGEIILNGYKDEEILDLFLENATFEAGEADCSTKGGTGTIEYTLSIPDVDEALDQEPDDIEELEEMIPELPIKEISFKVKFKLKGETWSITNFDAIMEKTYGYITGFDFGFIDYDEVVDSQAWYNTMDDGSYSGFATYIEYDIDFNTYVDMSYTYEFTSNDEVVGTGSFSGPVSYMSCYLYASDMDTTVMPAGTYTLTVKDSKDRVVFTSEVVVNEVDYADIIDHDNWYNRSEDPNIYSWNASYVDYDLYFTQSINIDLAYEWYYNGELVKEDEYSCGSYGYFYLYDEDLVAAGVLDTESGMPAGTYEVKIYDPNGQLITNSECIVQAFEGDAVVDHINWYNRDEDPNIYDADSNYLDFDVYYTDYYGGTVTYTFYYEGDEIYTGTHSSGSYSYCYCYLSDISDVVDTSNGFPTGTYTVTVWGADGSEIITESCVVR